MGRCGRLLAAVVLPACGAGGGSPGPAPLRDAAVDLAGCALPECANTLTFQAPGLFVRFELRESPVTLRLCFDDDCAQVSALLHAGAPGNLSGDAATRVALLPSAADDLAVMLRLSGDELSRRRQLDGEAHEARLRVTAPDGRTFLDRNAKVTIVGPPAGDDVCAALAECHGAEVKLGE
jgi:hypothetical protein